MGEANWSRNIAATRNGQTYPQVPHAIDKRQNVLDGQVMLATRLHQV